MSELRLRLWDTRDAGFPAAFAALRDRAGIAVGPVEAAVRSILADVRARGDRALVEYTRRFDRYPVATPGTLEVPRERRAQALRAVADDQRAALQEAAERIRRYHERQATESWDSGTSIGQVGVVGHVGGEDQVGEFGRVVGSAEPDGTWIGQQVTPIERVGIYVPGGKAAYPSSVLMNAIPAKVAGVAEIIMSVPAPGGELNDMVLAAADIAGVDRVFTLGGAQAVAALAYGTDTVPPVDKIVGPGNVYVATAKRLVYGIVDIDMIAGPSEIVVVCDGRTDADWIAMDLFSQAEHDEDAQAILISLDRKFTHSVRDAITRLLPEMERHDIIRASLEAHAALITARDLDEALALVNHISPEHLELSLDEPLAVAKRVRHAGAIFLGRHTAEVLGDYCAGPSHVLPTSGTARFSSPLGVYDFQKRTSLIQCSVPGAARLGRTASVLARAEGLTAHARSAEYRIGPR